MLLKSFGLKCAAPVTDVFIAALALMLCLASKGAAAETSWRIPAATAYVAPDVDGARVSGRTGIAGWQDPKLQFQWFGGFTRTGSLNASLLCELPSNQVSHLRLTLGTESHEARVAGAGTNLVEVPFGSFTLASTGYHRLTLQAATNATPPFPRLEALTLDGPAAQGAHFNLKPRRNAASVHLTYPVETNLNVAAFYCEMTGLLDPVYTYYMACGWRRGYFGMQVNGPRERRIIFSVWDSGREAKDRRKVEDENRVKLLGKGAGVDAGDFGNEGTGGHSHLVYDWKTGEPQRFLVTAQPTNQTFTVYSGYYFHPNQNRWVLISSWRAPKDGKWLSGLYSFSENFGGSNGHLPRKARYGNQWIQTDKGAWIELTTARFSHDATGKADRLDRYMGVENGEFFLSHGGFLPGYTAFGERFERPARRTPPSIQLPP